MYIVQEFFPVQIGMYKLSYNISKALLSLQKNKERVCETQPYWNSGAKFVEWFNVKKQGCHKDEDKMKFLIMTYGAVSTDVKAGFNKDTNPGFGNYKSGVYDKCT